MKNTTLNVLWVMLLAVMSWHCGNSPVEGTVITGTIENAPNMQAFVDHVVIGKASNIVGKGTLDANGNFEMAFPEGLTPGIYNLRIGAKRINLAMDGTEEVVEIKGDLNTLQNYDVSVSGSEDSEQLVGMMKGLIAREKTSEDIEAFIEQTDNPELGAFLAYRTLSDPKFLDIQKKALAKLTSATPDSEMTIEYAKYLTAVEQQYQRERATQRVQIGEPAPNIQMQDPYGKQFALSDLKGKIVLLDFWASWCGPCRRENPNVVKVYDKYKDQGFTVFSVSLDGLDDRTRQAMGGDEDQIKKRLESSRERWIKAIKDDNLKWPYHVSDLQKWNSQPAALYGVRSIPRTFLIDREGNIAALNLRGAEKIEEALQPLL